MQRLPRWDQFPHRFTLVMGLVALLLFIAEHVNGRFWLNDFRVYYGAASALLKGEALYGVAHGLSSGVFKYAPIMAFVYAPFSLLPYPLAASLQFALITAAFIGAVLQADRMVRSHLLDGRSPAYLPLFLTTLVVVVHLHRELHLGNINVMLLWVLLFGLGKLLNGRDLLGGMAIGLAMLAKPHFLVLLPLLLLYRRWGALAAMAGVLLLGFLLPSLFLGWERGMAMNVEWIEQMGRHNAALIYAGGTSYEAVNTVYSFLYRSLFQHFMATPGNVLAYGILGLIALTVGGLVLRNLRAGIPFAQGFTFVFLLLIALVPSITLTDTEHFLLAMPLVVYLVHHLVPKASPRWIVLVSVPILFAHGGNWEDLLGPWSQRLIHLGVLGIANILLIALTIALFLRPSKEPVHATS